MTIPTREKVEELHGRVSREGLDAIMSYEVDELCTAYLELEAENKRLLDITKMQDRFIEDKSLLAADRLQEIHKLEAETQTLREQVERLQSENGLLVDAVRRADAILALSKVIKENRDE